MKKTMQTYLNILKYPEHRYETLFFFVPARGTPWCTPWKGLWNNTRRIASHTSTWFSPCFPCLPPPWRPMAIRHLHGLQDLCRLFAVLLRWCSLAHLYCIRPWPRQSQIKRKPDESYLLLQPHFLWTGLGYGQILLSTYGKSIGTHVAVGPHILVADVQVPPAAVGPKLLKTSRARPKAPWLSFLSSTSVPLLWTKNNLNRTCTYTHTLACIIVQSSSSYIYIYMYNSGMYQWYVYKHIHGYTHVRVHMYVWSVYNPSLVLIHNFDD